MTAKNLIETARLLVVGNKGLLAMDESVKTCNKRFTALNIPANEQTRLAYRELLANTAGLGEFISGAILCDETIRQTQRSGATFPDVLNKAGIIPGIKVDMGTTALAGHPDEKITDGLDGLRARLEDYLRIGARFAKWRAVITVGETIPSRACIEANAHLLARYAALCQEVGLVPVVEPEVLMDGTHTMEHCQEVTEDVLRTVFAQLINQGVLLEGMILKPNMIVPGLSSPKQESDEDIAAATIETLLRTVPAAMPGIVFLSGGQSSKLATARLNAMNLARPVGTPALPWAMSFSYGRALQEDALRIWNGDDANVTPAQQALYHRAKCNWSARAGSYNSQVENTSA